MGLHVPFAINHTFPAFLEDMIFCYYNMKDF